MPGPIRPDELQYPLPRRARLATRRHRVAARGLAMSLASLAFAVGSAAASTQAPTGSGPIAQAVGSQIATVYTSLHSSSHVAISSAPVGSVVHAAFQVTGSYGVPTGLAVVMIYPNATCSPPDTMGIGAPLDADATIDSTANNVTSDVVATKSVRVFYKGDATYADAWGPCRTISFVKADPTVVLNIHDATHDVVDTVPFTSLVHADVDVSGAAGEPGNWVVVRAWDNAACSGSDYQYTSKFLDASGHAEPVLELGFDEAGVKSYRAHFSGDAKYNPIWSECKVVEATKVAPKLTLSVHSEIHDTVPKNQLVTTPVHVAYEFLVPSVQATGSVTVKLFNGDDCQSQLTQESGPTVGWYDNPDFAVAAPSIPTVISWQASYAGDSRYKAVTSACLSARWRALPGMGLTIHDGGHATITSAIVGSTVHLRATVNGSFGTPTGTVDLKVATDSGCVNVKALGSGTLSGGVLHDVSVDQQLASTGKLWFVAKYAGDDVYVGSTSACMELTVKSATAPTSAPTAAPTQATPGTTDPGGPAATDAPGSTPDAGASADPTTAGDQAGPSSEPTDSASTAAPEASDASAAGGQITPDEGGASRDGLGMGLLGLFLLLALLAGAGAWFLSGGMRKRSRAPGPLTDPIAPAQPS